VSHLTERALVEAQAGLGGAPERRHLESCLTCARRLQALTRDLAVIGWTLGKTAEPRPRPAVPFRRWMPAAAAATAMALAALLWVEVAVWRAVTTVPPGVEPEEARVMLAQVSSSLFSLRGDPPSAEGAMDADDVPGVGDDDPPMECAGAEWLLRPACGAGPS
jgi:hypothetical protein